MIYDYSEAPRLLTSEVSEFIVAQQPGCYYSDTPKHTRLASEPAK